MFLCVSGCTGSFYDVQGYVTSKYFPYYYDSDSEGELNCQQTIIQPEGTTVNITFDWFDIEPDENCNFDSVTVIKTFKTSSIVKYSLRKGCHMTYKPTQICCVNNLKTNGLNL